jgi:hypothetical protein
MYKPLTSPLHTCPSHSLHPFTSCTSHSRHPLRLALGTEKDAAAATDQEDDHGSEGSCTQELPSVTSIFGSSEALGGVEGIDKPKKACDLETNEGDSDGVGTSKGPFPFSRCEQGRQITL